MNPSDSVTLERLTSIFHSSRAQKLLRAPWRMISSGLRQAWSRTLNRPVPVRACTFWGQKMLVMLPEMGSFSLLRYRFIEEGLSSLLLRMIKPGMTFFDVGAHYGYFTLLGSKLVGRDGQVHAFDPSPETFAVLRKNAQSLPNVRLNNLALYSHEAELTLEDFGVEYSEFNSVAGGRIDEEARRRHRLVPRKIVVRAVSMDQYVQTSGARPDFVKIDAEGAEFDILKGMLHILADIRPMLTLEVAVDSATSQGDSVRNVRFLREQGYLPYEWRDGSLRAHEPRQSYFHDNLLFAHRDRPLLA